MYDNNSISNSYKKFYISVCFYIYMFKSPFSFHGRIRRLEFGLTYIIYFAIVAITGNFFDINNLIDSILLVLYIVMWWILLAQGAKRCHDLDNSGFFQIIPFYFFVMLLQEGTSSNSKYGLDPKSKAYLEKKNHAFSFKFKRLSFHSILEVVAFALFGTLMSSINNILFQNHDNYITIAYIVLPAIIFVIFLYFSHYKKATPINRDYLLSQQILFSILYYISIRIYTLKIRGAEFIWDEFIYEFVFIAIIFGLTFISVGLYKSLNKKPF